MANDAGFLALCHELIEPAGAVRGRRMFGGHGLYLDGHFIAIIAGNQLFLKVDDETRQAFVDAGSAPFAFDVEGRDRVVLSYWRAPEPAMEHPEAMRPWLRLALGAALRQAARKSAPARAAPRRRAKPAPRG